MFIYTLNHFIDELIQKRKKYIDSLFILINLCTYRTCVCVCVCALSDF